jgi:DNA transposition AAA+ family ATPase
LTHNRARVPAFPQYLHDYIADLETIVNTIEDKSHLTIASKQQEFACTVLLEGLVSVHRAVRAWPDDGLKQAVLKESKIEEVLKWVVSRYQWERSNKNQLEAILEMKVWSREAEKGAIKFSIDQL